MGKQQKDQERSWVMMDIQKISRQIYYSHMMPRGHSNTVLSVQCSSHSLSKYQHWMVVISAIRAVLPNDMPAYSTSLIWLLPAPGCVSAIYKAPKSIMTLSILDMQYLSFLPLHPRFIWQLLFVTASEAASQLESTGWSQRHENPENPEGTSPLPLSNIGSLHLLLGM